MFQIFLKISCTGPSPHILIIANSCYILSSLPPFSPFYPNSCPLNLCPYSLSWGVPWSHNAVTFLSLSLCVLHFDLMTHSTTTMCWVIHLHFASRKEEHKTEQDSLLCCSGPSSQLWGLDTHTEIRLGYRADTEARGVCDENKDGGRKTRAAQHQDYTSSSSSSDKDDSKQPWPTRLSAAAVHQCQPDTWYMKQAKSQGYRLWKKLQKHWILHNLNFLTSTRLQPFFYPTNRKKWKGWPSRAASIWTHKVTDFQKLCCVALK